MATELTFEILCFLQPVLRAAARTRTAGIVSRVRICVSVEKISDLEGLPSGISHGAHVRVAGAGGGVSAGGLKGGGGTSVADMRYTLKCKGCPGAVHTTCLLSWPSTGVCCRVLRGVAVGCSGV